MAHSLAEQLKPEMIWAEYPEDECDRRISFRSHVALVTLTQEALDRKRDLHVELSRRQAQVGELLRQTDKPSYRMLSELFRPLTER